jgi:YidC/Oxa1 family membrane protein insertase
MNIRDFVGPFLLTGALMFFFRDWFGVNDQPRTEFIAPASQAQLEPLYTTIHVEKNSKNVLSDKKNITIDTFYGSFTFSSYGAALEKAVLYQGKDKRTFTVFDESLSEMPEYAPLIVALEDSTVWNYKVHPVVEDDKYYHLMFTGETEEASIEKTFYIDKNKHKIDLCLTITPRNNSYTRARVIWPAPMLNSSDESKATQQVFKIDSNQSFKKYSLKNFNEQKGFFSPQIFGVESKYFVMSFFQGCCHKPIERAYCKINNGKVYAFIESQKITEKTKLAYSFALIPKDVATLYPDITVLEKTFDYGFFGFFSKLMLACLNFINSFIHNYGWSIIILICILKLLLLPLTYNSGEKLKIIKENERRFNYMQQKLQNDPDALNRLREEHVKKNLLSLLTTQGPLFVQMPFIVGLSGVVNNSLELSGAPFIGWLQDLSMPDKYYVLPVIFGILLFFNLINSKGLTLKKFVVFLAIALFAIGLCIHFSTGFMLFILVNMLFHVGQTFVVERVR